MNDAERDELLVRVEERVIAIQGRLEKGDTRLDNHSGRLQTLEKWRSALAAAVATILAGIALALRIR